jgi:hypothetical protein
LYAVTTIDFSEGTVGASNSFEVRTAPAVNSAKRTGTQAEADLLLIGGGFFGYAEEITRALLLRGRKVAWFEDRPALDTLTKSLLRVAPRLVAAKSEAYFEDVIAKMRKQPIRDILVIKGEALSPKSIERLRVAMPQARFTLYFWDSYRNMPKDSPQKVSLFDKSFTFDPHDAQTDRRLNYRPLFYLDDYASLPQQKMDIDLLFLGTIHSDRYAILGRLSLALPPDVRFEKILYFPSRIVYAARCIGDPNFWRARRDEFVFNPLSKIEIQKLVARARVVVDIERSVQSGLTMRTIEMLGAGKKLLTTNSRVVEADFFNPNNISIIDRRRPLVTSAFLKCAYEPPIAGLLKRYSLSGWLDEVLPHQPSNPGNRT